MLETGASLLEQRASVFDNDEFDVLRREDIDFSRVHIGKRYYIVLVNALLLTDSVTLHSVYRITPVVCDLDGVSCCGRSPK